MKEGRDKGRGEMRAQGEAKALLTGALKDVMKDILSLGYHSFLIHNFTNFSAKIIHS